MVSGIPTSEQMSEWSEQSKSERSKRSKAEHGRANEQASGALWSKQVNEQVALFNDAVFSKIDHSKWFQCAPEQELPLPRAPNHLDPLSQRFQ